MASVRYLPTRKMACGIIEYEIIEIGNAAAEDYPTILTIFPGTTITRLGTRP